MVQAHIGSAECMPDTSHILHEGAIALEETLLDLVLSRGQGCRCTLAAHTAPDGRRHFSTGVKLAWPGAAEHAPKALAA